ncbi:hypothetical protein GOP47_0014310 [Adiantum capillus-veneris]|uniref:Uncharacterized protein n=1 Tax=Adiantum capillus-veneris TaxID=13818 RepID=A0A9D4ZDD7_ADICA|nr:hypothetical protein GOP47_0014310 [Adiantum capillus-veneris]
MVAGNFWFVCHIMHALFLYGQVRVGQNKTLSKEASTPAIDGHMKEGKSTNSTQMGHLDSSSSLIFLIGFQGST